MPSSAEPNFASLIETRFRDAEDDASKIVSRLIEGGHRQEVCAGLAGLAVRVATGLPVAGAATEALLSKSFENAADRVVREELEAMIKEEAGRKERGVLVAEIRAEVEAIVGDAIVQIVRSQYASVADIPRGLEFRSRSMTMRGEFSLGLLRGRKPLQVIASIPQSSLVDPTLVTNAIVSHYAGRHPDAATRVPVVMQAVKLRSDVDPDARVPTQGDLPSRYEHDRPFWRLSFDTCCRYGSRMVAALLWEEFDVFDTSSSSAADDYRALWAHLLAGTGGPRA